MLRKFGLVGHPLGHSISKPIHEELFALARRSPARYELFEIPYSEITKSIKPLLRMSGFNITLPYKQLFFSVLKHHDISASRYGSVNTVKRITANDNMGYNTDVEGFVRSIDIMGASLSSKVLLLGCGGTGRMIAIETAYRGGSLTIATRPSSFEKAKILQQSIFLLDPGINVEIVPIDNIPHEHYDLVVNATPCGMFPNVTQMPMDPAVLKDVDHLFDVIYNPRETLLMSTAQKMGINVAGGMSMLVWQAAASHRIWDNVEYQQNDIQALIDKMNKLVGS